MIQWKRHPGGVFFGHLPGLILSAGPSHFRYACTRRWGWVVCDENGDPIAKSPKTRHSLHSCAMAGAIHWVRQYRPQAWQAAMAAAGDADG